MHNTSGPDLWTMPQPAVCVAPSLLAGNHAALGHSLAGVEASGAPWVHLDIMDGHFVPNLSFGPQTVADLRPGSGLFFDVHLMLDNPSRYLEAFARAGAQLITVHVEPAYDIPATLRTIKELGCRCGLAINPGTPVEDCRPYLDNLDLVLAMTVQPGFGGQAFRADVLDKVRQLAKWRQDEGRGYRIQVDGGVDAHTAPLCLQAGADTLVMGTAFFKSDHPAALVAAFMKGGLS